MKKFISIVMALAMLLTVLVIPASAAVKVEKKEFTYQSSDPAYQIHAISWKPAKGEIKGVIQFSHGISEYIDRYDSMARWFVNQGYAVYGNDHIGHGQSVTKQHPLGDTGALNGDGEVYVKDTKKLTDIAKKENPGVPYFLFGHSMGSFIARNYVAEYGDELDGVIFCGSGQFPDEALEGIGTTVEYIGLIQNGDTLDKAVATIMGQGSTSWLSVNKKNQEDYAADPLCGQALTVKSYGQAAEMIGEACSPETIGECPQDLPIFFISGSKDPVGLYGVGFKQAVNAYSKDHTNVTSKLYEGYKHEIHNDDCKLEVYRDILNFVQSNTK